ncbi:MAG TPA: CHAP domain-containing protein, partial [Candidatus Saccharimonadales bacterium]|nr:CHAP domain-containing protein [Candidatus Saccharimonadales bacterium]
QRPTAKTLFIRSHKIISLLIVGMVFLAWSAPALADQYDEQIKALKQQVSSHQAQVNKLRGEQDTLQTKVDTLNAQINRSATELRLAQVSYAKLVSELERAEKKLADKKQVLSESLRADYLQSQVTTLEVLASSDSFGEFLDRRQNLQNIKNSVQDAVAAIGTLKEQLKSQRDQQAVLIAEQKALQYGLGLQRGEVSSLLAETQNKEANYQAKISSQKQEITRLQAAQAAEIAARSRRVSSGGSGGYPAVWRNAPQNAYVDDWGFYSRQCTSFVAWWRAAHGYRQPAWGRMGYADAKTWGNWARASGFRVDRTPEVGAIGVYTSGTYGHVMIVIGVLGNSVRVANYNADFQGNYSEDIWPTASLEFIH